jgi:hypothetical protein
MISRLINIVNAVFFGYLAVFIVYIVVTYDIPLFNKLIFLTVLAFVIGNSIITAEGGTE